MDEKVKKNLKNLLLIISSFLLLFLFYYLIMAVIGSLHTYKLLIEKYTISDTTLIRFAKVNPELDSLLLQNSFLKAKSEVIESDSIYIFLNLKDSTISLEIQGVKLHEIKFNKIRLSKFLKKSLSEFKYAYISEPFIIEYYYATIPKVPIVVKKAPKDTIEAQKINEIPAIPPEDYVRCIFFTDKNLNIFIYQSEPPQKNHFTKWLKSSFMERWIFMKEILKGCVSFKIPEYKLWIKIEVPSADVKTIFRAIPVKGMIILYY